MNVVTPSLRFIGFQGRWHEANLEGISIKNISYGIVQTGEYIDDGVPCIRVVDLTKAKINKKTLIKTSNEISNSYRKTILEEGELMIALRGEIGLTQLVFEELVGCNLTRGVARVSPNKNLYDTRFLCAFLNSAKVRQEFDRRKNGSALKEIPISELKKFPVLFPELKEQQKIADFLTSVDTKISQLTEKHRLLKDYKKGVMQQIFSQQIRFKDDDGNAFPEWKKEKVGKYLESYKELVTADTNIPILTSSRTGLYLQERSVSNEGSYGVVPLGYFTYRHMSDDLIFKFNINTFCERGAVSKEYPVFKTVGMDSYFLQLQLNEGNDFKRFAIQQKLGGTRTRLYFKNLRELQLNLPCLEEQQKIAQFLQSLDKKTNAVNEQIEQTKLFKKGLLQQMFV
ncbi:restriction endonuclease subunit S [Pseudoalteromonas sp. SA25]|uniref:restriction endonuclease subunit S n=1 Tax=Pseudoalteromonas sp. SA25 TaxID=2686347 RepID=UPI0013FDFAA0|nr:restriction endonuclease subunit S [Pseudoalteromonas sp. SA25]